VGDRIPITNRPEGPWCPATIAGVYEPRRDPAKLTAERPRLLLHLPHLARLLGRPDEADRFSLRVRPASDVDALRRALDGQLVGAKVVPTDEVVGRASTTFEVVRRFHRAIGWITLAAGGAFLACIMILKVQERRVSIAALRLIGTSRRTLVGWLVLEAALLSTMGGVLGIGIGLLASTIINRYYQWAYDTTLVFSAVTPEVLLQALGLALTLGLAAGAAAMLRLLAVHPLAEAGR
jgi:putative ABC transport system permease protein